MELVVTLDAIKSLVSGHGAEKVHPVLPAGGVSTQKDHHQLQGAAPAVRYRDRFA